MRLLGVLVGSALAVAALVVFVGIPEFTTESSVAEHSVITLPMRATPPVPDPEPEPAPREEPVAAAIDGPADPPMPSEAVDHESEVEPDLAESPAFQEATVPQWYAFWSPFRSEIAANGFVAQLERVTGLDYRVVKVDSGVYEVAFPYFDDDERRSKLTQIAAATGLDLPDS